MPGSGPTGSPNPVTAGTQEDESPQQGRTTLPTSQSGLGRAPQEQMRPRSKNKASAKKADCGSWRTGKKEAISEKGKHMHYKQSSMIT